MKRILLFLSALFIATTAIAHTINWYVDGNIFHTTTCESGENVTPPTAPEKYGYTFQGWDAYTPIEYIESTGTQYIDTLIHTFNYIGIETKFQMMNTGDKIWFGTADSYLMWNITTSGTTYIRYGSTSYKSVSYNTGQTSKALIFLYSPYTLKIESGSMAPRIYVDNVLIGRLASSGDFSSSTETVRINYLRTAPSARWYSFKILDNNGSVLFDGKPAIGTNGIAGMYDLVTHKMFYSATEDNFIAGPIVGE